MEYNYRSSIASDARDFVLDELDLSQHDSVDEVAQDLYEILLVTNSSTGSASGSYTSSGWAAKQYVLDNLDLVVDLHSEGILSYEDIGCMICSGAWELLDVHIRCHLLPLAIDDALKELAAEGLLPSALCGDASH